MGFFFFCQQPGCNKKFATEPRYIKHACMNHGRYAENVVVPPIEEFTKPGGRNREPHQRNNRRQRQQPQVEQPPPPVDKPTDARIEELEERLSKYEDVCCICMDLKINAIFLDCGHMSTCIECAKEQHRTTRKCPMCRGPSREVKQVFSDV